MDRPGPIKPSQQCHVELGLLTHRIVGSRGQQHQPCSPLCLVWVTATILFSPPQPWGFSCLEKLCLFLVTCSCGCRHGWLLPPLGHSPVPLGFVAPLVPALGPVTFDTPIISFGLFLFVCFFFFSTSFLFGTTDFFCVFLHTALKSDISPRSPGSCSYKMILETKIWSWVCTQLWALLRWHLTMCSHRGNCCHKHPQCFC